MIKIAVISYIAFQAATSLILACSKPSTDKPTWLQPWRVGCLLVEVVLLVFASMYL